MILKKKLLLVLLFLIVLTSGCVSAEEVYSAYPIVFVHGFKANIDSWDSAKKYFEQYFVDVDGYPKYPYKRLFRYMENFPVCDYGSQKDGPISRNGSIPHIARGVLKQSIDDAINAVFPDGYKGEKKVNIVAHSMGGLVVRSLLTQYLEYQSKINKVIFIGTPHEGSPYASALWIINKEATEVLPPLIDNYSNAYSKMAGVLKFLFPQTTNLPFNQASSELQQRLNRDKVVLFTIDKADIVANSYAVEQMRLPFNCSYYDEIKSRIGFKSVMIPIYIDYQANTTFLGQSALLTPNDFLTIRGENPNPEDFLNEALDRLNQYREGVPFGFNFPSGYTITEAKSPGDGFVTQQSQRAIGGEVKKITALHTEETTNSDTFKYILEKLDDKPLLDLSVIPGDGGSYLTPPIPPTFYYIKVKVKDYLLADIEIIDMIVNGTKLDLTGFLDPQTNTYRPYFKYGKDFLKQRPDADAPLLDAFGKRVSDLVLKPGEFWVRINSPKIYDLFVKVRNPAQKETFKEIILPRYMNTFRAANSQGSSQNGLSFSDISQAAYASLLSGRKRVLDENVDWHYTLFLYRIGMEAHSTDSPYQGTGPDGIIRTEHNYTANIFSFYGSWVGLRFNSPPDLIKPFKLSFPTSFVGQFADSSQDINIRVYHDSSNAWPPAPDSSADTLLSTFNITPFMSQYIEVDIDPQRDIGPGGWYVLQFRPDFEEYNCIPDPTVGNFYRMAEVYPPGYPTPYPYVTVEEKE